MAQIEWTQEAINDLDDLAAYIALDKPSAASSLVQKVFDRVEQLRHQPDSGRHPPELDKRALYRELIVGPCRVFYRQEKNKLIIVHIMRSERELRRYMLREAQADYAF